MSNTRFVRFNPSQHHSFGLTATQSFPTGISGEEADRAIAISYGRSVSDISFSQWRLIGESNDNNGTAVGAVVGGTFGLIGGLMARESDAATNTWRRRKMAKMESVLKNDPEIWKKHCRQMDKERNVAFAICGTIVAIPVYIALWEVTVPLTVLGGLGYGWFKANKFIDSDKTNNNPPQVQDKYRKETIK